MRCKSILPISSQMLSSEQNPKVSDTTGDDSPQDPVDSNTVD
jgi:hypothetical protein